MEFPWQENEKSLKPNKELRPVVQEPMKKWILPISMWMSLEVDPSLIKPLGEENEEPQIAKGLSQLLMEWNNYYVSRQKIVLPWELEL